MSEVDDVIFFDPAIFRKLVEIFPMQGEIFPAKIASGKTIKLNKHKLICATNCVEPHSKSFLKYYSGEEFLPDTYFSGDRTVNEGTSDKFFLKPCDEDNGKGIDILKGVNLPQIVPDGFILQREVIPELYNGRKYDIRVLCCARRDGKIMLYKNLLFRINPYQFAEEELKPANTRHQLTNTAHNDEKLSFFDYDRRGAMPTKCFTDQLVSILPKIFHKVNSHIRAECSVTKNISLSRTFILGGLDFIPEKDTLSLRLLEYNSVPGYKGWLGYSNYQLFYRSAMDFMRGKPENNDDCIYI